MTPIGQVWQVNAAVLVHVTIVFDLHVGGGFNIAQRRIVRMSVHDPNFDRNVVCASWK